MTRRRRLDAELVRRGLAGSRSAAQDAVRAGLVRVGGVPAKNVATMVATDAAVVVGEIDPDRYVSRGATKLAAALDRFLVDPSGERCLDAGASTGGFTDCLLRRGAAHVVAVDVGSGQLAWTLRTDDRVTVRERTNVRMLDAADLPYAPGLVVADLSFISLTLALPALAAVAARSAAMILLVKPQFEATRGEVAQGGVVRDPRVWRRAVERVAADAAERGFTPVEVMSSPLRGPAGNVEFLVHALRDPEEARAPLTSDELTRAIDEGEALAP